MIAYERIASALEARGLVVKATGSAKSSAQCPAHDDSSPSLSVTGIEGQVLMHCHAGCATIDVLAALEMGLADLYDEPRGAVYRYDNGRAVHRSPDKRFRQTDTGSTPELYRLAKVREAVAAGRPVFVVEGEKCVHALEAVGVAATAAPMGAGKWSKIDPTPLYGGKVLVIADQDKAGHEHAADVYASLATHADVAVFAPKVGKDAADHIAAGYGVEDFLPVADAGSRAVSHLPSRPVLGDAAYQGFARPRGTRDRAAHRGRPRRATGHVPVGGWGDDRP